MDLDWARDTVQALLVSLDVDKDGYVNDDNRSATQLRINKALPLVARIAVACRFMDDALAWQERAPGWEWALVEESAQQLLGYLEALEQFDVQLVSEGPQLSADRFHEWVWTSAASLWSNGHRRAAVQTAATMVDVQAQAKLDRYDISGAELMLHAFSIDPPKKGKVQRLRFTHLQSGSESYKSAHEGAKFFGAGCMLGIRNLVTHTVDEPEPQVALEHLAALSVLARWIDEAIVVESSAV